MVFLVMDGSGTCLVYCSRVVLFAMMCQAMETRFVKLISAMVVIFCIRRTWCMYHIGRYITCSISLFGSCVHSGWSYPRASLFLFLLVRYGSLEYSNRLGLDPLSMSYHVSLDPGYSRWEPVGRLLYPRDTC